MDQGDSGCLVIGNQKQSFFDEVLLESLQDVARNYHQPVRSASGPVLWKDRPWEHVLLCRTSSYRVLRDSKDRLFKCWYTDEGIDPAKYTAELDNVPYRQLYAWSEDGIHWIKPELGRYYLEGRNTNIIWGDREYGSRNYDCYVIEDPFEVDQEKRFKTLCVRHQKGLHQVEAVYSADGLNWKTYGEPPVFGKLGPHLGDVLIISYDLQSRSYVLMTRHPLMDRVELNPRNPVSSSFFAPYYPGDPARENRRRIYQCESSDFLHWGEPCLTMKPDGEDNLDDSLYGMVRYRLGDVWVGFVNVLHQQADTMETQLAFSRDGHLWRRVHRSWLAPNPGDSWDGVMVEMCNEPVVVGDELWFYFGASGWGHHDWYLSGLLEGLGVPEARDVSRVSFDLGLAVLKVDRFCSLDAGPVREGIVITKPLESDGTTLMVNAECRPDGSIDAEIVAANDEPIRGFGRGECDTFRGDSVSHLFSWHGLHRLPAGQRRKVRFYMKDASLYTFRFSCSGEAERP